MLGRLAGTAGDGPAVIDTDPAADNSLGEYGLVPADWVPSHTEGLDIAQLVGMIDQGSPESVGVRTLDPGNPR
jgi:hypothetical protein